MSRRKKGIPLSGWINLDKPEGLTSTQALGKVRRILNAQKIGHAGTLDPLATGILPLALGEATKTIPFVQDADKVYRFTVTWGVETNTDDSEGECINTSEARPLREDIEALLAQFTGDIEQIPPQFSAIKIDGQRAYALARKGEAVDIKPRPVTVHTLTLLDTQGDSADFEMQCSKGTYVRAVARDMGRILGCFGHISTLRRTAVGVFSEKTSVLLDELSEMVHSTPPEEVLLPVETPLDDIPALALTSEETNRIRNGQKLMFISRPDMGRLDVAGIHDYSGLVLAIGHHGPLGLLDKDGIALQPVKLFHL